MQRRRFLGLGATVVAIATARATASVAATRPAPASSAAAWYAAARVGENDFRAVALGVDGRPLADLALPSRAHGLTTHARRGIGCVFARRPGHWLCTFDLADLAGARVVDATPGRRFSGHGVYSRSGRWLYTTENDIDRQRGVIGVRDTSAGYRHVAEFETGGIGPHELVRPAGSDLLVVANGGIATHPDHGDGRAPLNLDSMAPSIVVLDPRDGARAGRRRATFALGPEHHRISLRHLAVDGERRVWFAARYATAREASDAIGIVDELADAFVDTPPLAGWLSLEDVRLTGPSRARVQRLHTFELPTVRVPHAHGYLSSVAADDRHAVFTAARDGIAFRIDTRRRALDGVIALTDCSGVARVPGRDGGFVLSNGLGDTLRWQDTRVTPLARSDLAWDNHLVVRA